MPLFALQRCNLTHREMTIAGRLMGANNRGNNELTIQCHFYTFARCGDAAGLVLTVNHRLQSCDWCPQFCTSRYTDIHNILTSRYADKHPNRPCEVLLHSKIALVTFNKKNELVGTFF